MDINKEVTYTIFDLEATCYNNDKEKPYGFVNEIIEIGAVKLDKDGNEIGRYSKFSKPLLFPIISEFCNSLTTITQEDIDNSDDLCEVLVDFLKWVDGGILVSWGHYDKSQMKKDLIRNGLDFLLNELNGHISLKHLHGKRNGNKRGFGMKKALIMEGFKLDGTHHRGIDDAINITKIFKKIYLNK